MTPCIHLGNSLGFAATVACLSIEGYGRSEEVFACNCPGNARPDGSARRCIPGWAGPWKLPDRRSEAQVYPLCLAEGEQACPHRQAPSVTLARNS